MYRNLHRHIKLLYTPLIVSVHLGHHLRHFFLSHVRLLIIPPLPVLQLMTNKLTIKTLVTSRSFILHWLRQSCFSLGWRS